MVHTRAWAWCPTIAWARHSSHEILRCRWVYPSEEGSYVVVAYVVLAYIGMTYVFRASPECFFFATKDGNRNRQQHLGLIHGSSSTPGGSRS